MYICHGLSSEFLLILTEYSSEILLFEKRDFAVQTEKRVIPIEAKAEENVKGKSLKTYINEHPALKGLRVSMKNYIDQGWMENLPLYAIEAYLRAEGIPVPEQGE